eukprot:2240533-Amphidinium_carterae.1
MATRPKAGMGKDQTRKTEAGSSATSREWGKSRAFDHIGGLRGSCSLAMQRLGIPSLASGRRGGTAPPQQQSGSKKWSAHPRSGWHCPHC